MAHKTRKSELAELLDLNQVKKGVSLVPFITRFTLSHEFNWAAETHKTYEHALRQFESYRIGRKSPPLDHLLIKQYVRQLKLRRLSSAYIQRQLSVLRTFSAWAIEEGILPKDPTDKIPLPKLNDEYRREALDTGEINNLMDQVVVESFSSLRDYLLISLLKHTAVRQVELHRANIEDYVKKEAGALLYVHGKGRSESDSYNVIVPALVPIMDKYIDLRGVVAPKSPLFIAMRPNKGSRLSVRGIQSIVTKYLIKAGVKRKRVTAHSLRHSAATEALKNGANLERVRDMMRHKSMNTTMKYVHMVRRIEDGAESYIKIDGKVPDLSHLD